MQMLLFLLLGLLASVAHAIAIITAKGAKFFTSDGNQFFLKGVAYQLLPDDPLIDNDQCTRDADLMKTLGANSIRVYHVDPRADHDGCMKTFADAGIYIWLDLDTFDSYIQGPGMPQPQWNQSQFEAYQAVMDVFHKYDNLAGFFVGNEVLTSPDTDVAAPYVKAAAADMKAYRDGKNYRKIPIGYTAADVATLRPMLQNYLACGEDSANAVDFYGLNAYEWCGDSTFETSGYIFLQQNASEYNIPIFFSETGCNVGASRTFDDQAAIFGDKMVDTWSGAIIYEWIQETNDYGLVEYSLGQSSAAAIDGADAAFGRNGTPQLRNPDFENLSKHWATLAPTGIRADDYKPSLSAPVCPDFTTGAWEVKPDAQLPTIGYGDKAVSSASNSDVPTSIVTATGQAIPGNSKPTHESAHAIEASASATSSAAASGMLNVTPGSGILTVTWLGSYVALCAVAGMFFVL